MTFSNIFHLSISITASTSISGKYVSNISSQLLPFFAISFPPYWENPSPCPFPLHKKRTIFPTFCTEKSAEALEALDCLIWSGSCENVLSEEADSLLEEYPRLAVIFVADSPDAVFDALTKPFFHVVRGYALEQDLKAALAKLKKQRRTGSGYRSFPYRESPSSDGRIRVREKEILYLESMRHEIWVHCEKKVFLTSETLGYWEEKLRVRSFLRVHKSFLVNPGQISRIGREMIELEDGSQLPVSRYRYPEVMARYEAWIRHAEFLE